jgi:hypothetical protein
MPTYSERLVLLFYVFRCSFVEEMRGEKILRSECKYAKTLQDDFSLMVVGRLLPSVRHSLNHWRASGPTPKPRGLLRFLLLQKWRRRSNGSKWTVQLRQKGKRKDVQGLWLGAEVLTPRPSVMSCAARTGLLVFIIFNIPALSVCVMCYFCDVREQALLMSSVFVSNYRCEQLRIQNGRSRARTRLTDARLEKLNLILKHHSSESNVKYLHSWLILLKKIIE